MERYDGRKQSNFVAGASTKKLKLLSLLSDKLWCRGANHKREIALRRHNRIILHVVSNTIKIATGLRSAVKKTSLMMQLTGYLLTPVLQSAKALSINTTLIPLLNLKCFYSLFRIGLRKDVIDGERIVQMLVRLCL